MSANAKMCAVGQSYLVDVQTGEAVPIEGGQMRMMPVKPGTCEWCAVNHGPDEPHDKQSLHYQMKFHAIHGRWPTWTDAMAHCDEATQSLWRRELLKLMRENKMQIPDDLTEDSKS